MKNRKIPIACGFYIKNYYPDIFVDKYEIYAGDDIVGWFVDKIDYYNKLFKEILKVNIPLKEDTITQLYTSCHYCNEEMGDDNDGIMITSMVNLEVMPTTNVTYKLKKFCTNVCIKFF